MSDSYVRVVAHNALWAPLTAFTASLLLVWWLALGRFSAAILDHPVSRSLHEVPVPRTGGLGIHAGLLIASGMIWPAFPSALWIGFAALTLISFLDDLRGIAPARRLLVHLFACGLFSYFAMGQYGFVAAAIATLACTWAANLYNFMDGSDGLAGGMTVSGFLFYGIAAWQSGNTEFALLSFSVSAAALGFLVFNFHPARIFLGDVGSVPLGFLAASLGIVGCLKGIWDWWYPVLVFSAFIVDASVTLARRAIRLEKIWQAHRDHYYQRLVRMGWGHRKTALAEYALMTLSGFTALVCLSLREENQIAVLAVAAIIYMILIGFIEFSWRRHTVATHP